MNEREQAERFNRQLERLIHDQPIPSEDLSPDERAALEMSRILLKADFSAESVVQDPLRARLLEKSASERSGFTWRTSFQGLAWGAAGLALVLLLSWAIRSLLPRPAAHQPAAAPANTSAAFEPTSTPQSTPTSAQELPEITHPLVETANIRDIYWSSDGAWLGFLSQDEEQVQNSPGGEGYLPPAAGTVHFVNLASGDGCQYEMDNPQGLDFYRWYAAPPSSGAWLVIGRAGEIFQLSQPCTPGERTQVDLPATIEAVYPLTPSSGSSGGSLSLFMGASACWLYDPVRGEALSVNECSREASISPEGGYIGMTLTEDGVAHRTLIVDAGSGQTIFEHAWMFSDGGLGFLPAPIWLSETDFIVYRSDQGPLLVSLAPETTITHIADDLFGIPGAGHQYAHGQASADSSYHIIFTDLGADYTRSNAYIYHGESGVVESLPEDARFLSFRDDGSALDIEMMEIVDGYEQGSRYTRSLDPSGSPLEPYTPSAGPSGSLISPDGSLRVEITPAQITPGFHIDVLSTVDESSLRHWLIQGYEPERFSWSPHENAIAVVASDFASQFQAVYLLQFR